MSPADKFRLTNSLNEENRKCLTEEAITRLDAILDEVFVKPVFPVNTPAEVMEDSCNQRFFGRLVLETNILFDILNLKQIKTVKEYKESKTIAKVLQNLENYYHSDGIVRPYVSETNSVDKLPKIEQLVK